MSPFLLFSLLPWLSLVACAWPLRRALRLHGRLAGPWIWGAGAVIGVACFTGVGEDLPLAALGSGALGWGILPPLGATLLQAHREHLRHRLHAAHQEQQWILEQRGTVQQQIMRTRETEAMDRRLRRCRSALLLSRGNAEDLDRLLRALESALEDPQLDGPEAAERVGGMAAHLRHVFIERDRDELPLADICRHVDRWAHWLRDLGLDVRVEGRPNRESHAGQCKVPSMLFLGAAERWGMDALNMEAPPPMVWSWSCEGHTVRLRSTSVGDQQWPESELREWDAAFMLRHGGIAHAGGHWECELPLA